MSDTHAGATRIEALETARAVLDAELLLVKDARPDFWRCKACGCLWRDNHDNTVSLGSAKQTSCVSCEQNPTSQECEPLYRAYGVLLP